MSMNIYAGKTEDHPDFGKTMGPVIDFRCWDAEILAEDADAREERGENPFIPNSIYIPDGGMNLSNDKAETLFAQLGFVVDSSHGSRFPIEEVQRAAMHGRNGAAARHTEAPSTSIGAQGATMIDGGIPEGYMERRIGDLLALIAAGRKLGATHVVVA